MKLSKLLFWKRKRQKTELPKFDPRAGLEYAFTDIEGRKYFRFTDEAMMPVERVGKLQEYTMWISRGLNDVQMNLLLNRMEELIFAGLKEPKNASKLAAVVSEMRERASKIAPVALYYNFLAVQFVREDEPLEFVESVHNEKVQAFALSAEGGNRDSFFFHLPESKELFRLLNLLTPDWQRVLEESKIQEEVLNKLLQITEPQSS